MPVIKSKLQTRYFIYPNAVAQSKISLEAKGLIAYMSSKPDDWIFHKSEIMKECKVGRDKLNKIYKELELSGNLVVTQLHDKEGKFSRTETLFFVDPENNPAFIPLTEKQPPCTDLPLTDSPYTDKQHLQSKDIIQKKDNTNNNAVITAAFDYFWGKYPVKRRKNKSYCFGKFKSLCKGMGNEQIEELTNKITKDVENRISEVDDIKYLPTTEPYLRQERWRDYE
jgi:hypothetical protein